MKHGETKRHNVMSLYHSSALVHTKPVPTGNKNMTDWQKLEALFDMESNCECLFRPKIVIV